MNKIFKSLVFVLLVLQTILLVSMLFNHSSSLKQIRKYSLKAVGDITAELSSANYRIMEKIQENAIKITAELSPANYRIMEKIQENTIKETRLNGAFIKYLSYYRDKKVTRNLPNIILIVHDAFRSDHVRINDKDAPMTPNFDQFASKGVNFKNAITSGAHSAPAITSLLTGLYPNVHGNGEFRRDGTVIYKLSSKFHTLAEILKNHGYFTGLFGYDTGIDNFRHSTDHFYYIERSLFDYSGSESIKAASEFIRSGLGQPYFLMLYTFHPHSPYIPKVPPIYPSELANLSTEEKKNFENPNKIPCAVDKNLSLFDSKPEKHELYERGRRLHYSRIIEELDERMGIFFNLLETSKSEQFDYKKDIVILTSDHGEEFYDENMCHAHGESPYIETQRVPLMMRFPGVKSAQIEHYVENSGIFPTLLEYLNIPDPRPSDIIHPRSLLSDMRRRKPDANTTALSEFLWLDIPGGREVKTIIRSDGKKLMYDTLTRESRIFDLEKDPHEENDISNESQELYSELLDELKRKTTPNKEYFSRK